MGSDLAAFSPGSLAARLLASLHSSRVTRLRVRRGAAVFRQGDRAAAVFLVESGRIRLIRVLPDGVSVVLYVADAGGAFAEASLSAERYHCDAVADADSVVLALPKLDLLAALAADPAECLALAQALASQVRDLRAMLELRNVRSAAARLLAWMRLRATGDPPLLRVSRAWTLVADELGLSREAVYRALATLEREGKISRDADAVRLLAASEPTR